MTRQGLPPTVVIVGRPNVGKSTLFNRLVGKRLALVDDRPGVTRDRREGEGHLLGLDFRIVDTAGFEEDDPASLPGRMRAQTEAAIDMADVALFLIDARVGVTPVDEEIARWLRDSDTPIIVIANKAEGKVGAEGVSDAWRLGLGEPFGLSAEHGDGVVDLFDALRPHIERDDGTVDIGLAEDEVDLEEVDLSAPLKLAIVGRPNAGKSTLVNRLLGEDRLITGPEAGITRDSITIDWEWEDFEGVNRPVRIIDTAGLRKKAKIEDKLEKLSVADTLHSVAFAEVVVLLLDATLGLEAQDLRIADHVINEGRALMIAINKWDVAEDASKLFNGVRTALDESLAQVRGAPLVAVSAVTGKGLDTMIGAAFDLRAQWSRRVGTGEINRWFERAVEGNPPPAPKGKRIKLRYITQARLRPPSFVAFGTRVDLLPESYRRYLVNGIRRDLGFPHVPIRLTFRSSSNPFGDAERKSADKPTRRPTGARGPGGGGDGVPRRHPKAVSAKAASAAKRAVTRVKPVATSGPDPRPPRLNPKSSTGKSTGPKKGPPKSPKGRGK